MQKVETSFPITVYGKREKFNDTISRGRCRVFYKGLNRNGTYITDDFAEKLIASAPYTPVKGIYEAASQDYSDHGKARTEGRIYGIVPADPHFAWEKHLDSDGVVKEYACFDVLYYTALYEEAAQIDGKAQSMELYRKTLKGDWRTINGTTTFVFTDGCFLGLQVLGDETEPCFQGAGFYSRNQEVDEPINIMALLEKYEKRTDIFQYQEQGDLEPMPDIETVFESTEETTAAEEVVVETEAQESAEVAEVENEAVTENETEVEEELAENEEKPEQNFAALQEQIDALTQENLTFSTKVDELNTQIATLITEGEKVSADYAAAQARITELETNLAAIVAERDELATYKKTVEDNKKKDVISTYAEQLSEEIIEKYMNSLDDYSLEDLDKELTYEQKKANPAIFSTQPTAATAHVVLVPKDEDCGRTITDILAKYERH